MALMIMQPLRRLEFSNYHPRHSFHQCCFSLSFFLFSFFLLLFLPKLMWFDLVENTLVSDTLLVPPVFGFILTSTHVVLVVVGVHEWLMDL
jgi:hypothetical protein